MALNQPGFGNLNRPLIKGSPTNSRPGTLANPGTTIPVRQSGLEKMKTILNFLGYQTLQIPVDEDNIAERLLVTPEPVDENEMNLDQESKQELLRNRSLIQIMFLDDLVPKPEENTDKFIPNTLQFYIALPFTIGMDKLLETYRFLAFMNQLIHIGNFNLDNNGVVYYKYSFLIQKKEIDNVLLVEIIQLIDYFIKKFSGKILDFVKDEKTLDQVIAETEKDFLPQN